jgi:serine/threonine-protein kinase
MTLWHLLGNPGQHGGLTDHPVSLIANESETLRVPVPANIKQPVSTKDNAILRYVPGGKLTISEDRSVAVKPFYMDETPVTNMQYVSFLNEVRSRVRINNNVVTGDEKIWLMLGEVTEGYDPIIYSDDKFSVKHPGHAACPVLRVTAFGALAYAQFYGKRLPTDIEWIYAFQGATESPNSLSGASCEQKPIPTPVILLDANSLGIKGLNQCINEWTALLSVKPDNDSREDSVYSIIGNVWNKEKKNDGYSEIERQPWESFEEVGFRCVIDASGIDSKLQEHTGQDPSDKPVRE